MTSEDGEVFIKHLAQFVRTHEKALANAMQLQRQPTKNVSNISRSQTAPAKPTQPQSTPSTSSTLAAALSLGSLSFTSQTIKTAKLTLTPHHLFYLLSRFEELGVEVGPLNVRVENLHTDTSPANYVSFLSQPSKSQGRSDRDSIHSVSSVRSVMSNMSSFWSSFGIGNSAAKGAKAQAQLQADLKYLYSAFTMIPCLRLSPDRKARLISGFEEFPFDTAVPLVSFKNVSALEICDLDFRSFFGWDRLADQLRSLTIKRGKLDDLLDLLVHIVLDDMDKRRRRSSSKTQYTPPGISTSSPQSRQVDVAHSSTPPASPLVEGSRFGSSASPRNSDFLRGESDLTVAQSPKHARNKSLSPSRPSSGRPGSSYHRHVRSGGDRMKRSGSGSSNSSTHSLNSTRNRSSSNLLSMGILPASKWRFLRHLCIADNGLTELTASGLAPLQNTLVSLDLSSNLFTEVPDCLVILTGLRALNLSNCMIKSLHSLARNPLPAITAMNLRANRLVSIAGIERLYSLERLDLRDNRILDPMEMARLTGHPEIHELWIQNNPLTSSHTNYRVTIFNLFRGTPGYTEDITIDNSGPGYSERRHLRERASESNSTTVKPKALDFEVPPGPVFSQSSSLERDDTVLHSRELLGNRPAPHSIQSEMTVGSKRKKSTRRRIVDLSADNNLPSNSPGFKLERHQTTSDHIDTDPVKNLPRSIDSARYSTASSEAHFTDHYEPQPITPPPAHPDPEADVSSLLPLTEDLKQLTVGGEAYRQKVQALKDEFGSSWLRMLGDVPQAKRSPSFTPGPTNVIHQDIPGIRSSSQSIVSGSRTLG